MNTTQSPSPISKTPAQYACGSNAFWCGRVDSSWTGDPNFRGYENNWVQTLQNFADLAGAPSPYTISFRHRMNVETGFDFGYVEVQDDTGDWITLAQYSGAVNDGGASLCNTATLTIPDSIVTQASPTRFRFMFTSDLEGSSEDGLYAAGEGWSIDDVTVKGGVFDVRFFDDMEAGLGTWTRSTFPAVGDYWRIALNPVTQLICTTNPGSEHRNVQDHACSGVQCASWPCLDPDARDARLGGQERARCPAHEFDAG